MENGYAFPGESAEWTAAYLAALNGAGSVLMEKDRESANDFPASVLACYAADVADATVGVLAERRQKRAEEQKQRREEAIAKVQAQKTYREDDGTIWTVAEIDGVGRVRLSGHNGGFCYVNLFSIANLDEECAYLRPYNA